MFENMMDTRPVPPSSSDRAEDWHAAAEGPPMESGLRPSPGSPGLARSNSSARPDEGPLPANTKGLREHPIRDVFVGPNGLYAGTRWIIYLAMVFLVYAVAEWLTQQFRAENAGFLVSTFTWEITVFVAAIVPAFLMAVLEERSLKDFGLPINGAVGKNFWQGALWGMGSLTALMLTLQSVGAFEFGSLALHGFSIAKYAFYHAMLFLATGLAEEFLFRGYSQWVLARGMNFWPAAALLSVGFGAVHTGNTGEAKSGVIAAGLIGFFFCLTLRRTGSLWWAIGFHMSWDWGESFFYSVPDSGGLVPGHLFNSSFHGKAWLTGGTVGPEGSALIFALLALLWIAFDRMHPEIRYQPE